MNPSGFDKSSENGMAGRNEKGGARTRRRWLPRRVPDGAGHHELTATLDCDGLSVPVLVRRSARAKRIILRLPPGEYHAVVSLPHGTPLEEGLAFARSRRDWIARHLRQRGTPRPFRHGEIIPYRGEDHLIVHVPGRGAVWREETAGARRLCVAGAEEHLSRRLTDWLKAQARTALLTSCRHYAHAMDVRFTRLSVRDQKSRWGSCSSRGGLNFSWRVILAPHFVLDYLAAHEVAHLMEMNHSPRFWRLVAAHCPHWQRAERWLKRRGDALHLIGTEGPDTDRKS